MWIRAEELRKLGASEEPQKRANGSLEISLLGLIQKVKYLCSAWDGVDVGSVVLLLLEMQVGLTVERVYLKRNQLVVVFGSEEGYKDFLSLACKRVRERKRDR